MHRFPTALRTLLAFLKGVPVTGTGAPGACLAVLVWMAAPVLTARNQMGVPAVWAADLAVLVWTGAAAARAADLAVLVWTGAVAAWAADLAVLVWTDAAAAWAADLAFPVLTDAAAAWRAVA